MDGPGTWQEESILIAMIIYSFLLLTLSILWLIKYYSINQNKPKKLRLILVYALSPWLINILGQIIVNIRFSDKLNSYIGLHLFWGETKDILITIIAPLLPPVIISLILMVFLKRHHVRAKRKKEDLTNHST